MFCSKFLIELSYKILWNKFLLIPQNSDFSKAIIEADLYAWYINASSPTISQGFKSLIRFPLIITETLPEDNIKQWNPSSPYWNKN